MVHSFELLFVIDQPFDRTVDACLHVFLLLVSELKDALWSVTKVLFHIQLNFFKYFAFDILLDLLLCILSLFQPFIQNLVVASHYYNKVEPFRRED